MCTHAGASLGMQKNSSRLRQWRRPSTHVSQAGSDEPGSRDPSQAPQQQQQQQPQQEVDPDLLFMGKLFATSFAISAIIKWGSLLTPIPFTPNSALAAVLVIGPPAFYAALFLSKSK
ncbi:hypothetical protein DUNSADRAFT_518 [Dunaliella salina]|uniref:Uncharacterized protein n=1 Tax=Dunaliella salina TaxID=3046 RepID=A0ABQ7GY61_DUNSA|nr:hypothetical protein DUNSADRAFT_518 [Dunaliella salina]|eukprot:KAF5839545.1 hypothetical protein DUNSADRAFT_518 [Dunaliella salina]